MNKSTRIIAMFLALVMILGILPMSVFAAEYVNTMTIASKKVSALAPGVTETEVVAYDKNGNRIVYYVVNADIATNSDVLVKANYHDNDNTGVWGKATVVEQANAAAEKRGYNVVASTNAAYYNVSTGQPTGAFVMEGVNINGDSMGNQYEFFAIMKDGSAMIGKKNTFSQYSADIQEAVAGHLMLIWDGKICDGLDQVSKYPRSTVGIKADGNVVLMLADGNQKPYSVGLTFAEQAEVMYSLGCVYAIELDGGGSATYAAKLEGTDEVVVRNSCCDGTVRSVSNTLMVISNAVADGTFHHANLSTEYAFYAANSTVAIEAVGADVAGGPAELPELTWVLSDDSFGTVANGVFTSNGKIGTVTVYAMAEGEAVGSVEITVAHPETVAFSAAEKTVPYGRTSDFTISALYNGAEIYIQPDSFDFAIGAGSMDGFVYTAPGEDAGITKTTVTATYKYADITPATVTVVFGKGSDILVNFEDADVSEWTDYFGLVEAAEDGRYTGGYTNNHEATGSTSSNLIEYGMREEVFLASRENGDPVYSGDYALGYTLDYTQSTVHQNWMYAYLYYFGDTLNYRDVENGLTGTRVGMWMYIPEEAVGLCARLGCTYTTTSGDLAVAYRYMTYQYVDSGFSKLTSEKIPEAGWTYVYCDLDPYSKSYAASPYYKDENGNVIGNAKSNYAPAFIQFIVSSSATGAEKCTLYIDDITLDYSDVVDDRDAPLVTNPVALDDLNTYPMGSTLNFNNVSFTADVAEDTVHATNFTGLDSSTAQIYVDGHKVATTFSAGKIATSGLVLANGIHDISFEIADKQGNYTKVTKQITIAANTDYPVITVSGYANKTKADGKLYTGSQYNITINTDKVEAIDTISTKIWLNSASKWALEHMTTLSGFEATYDLDERACTAEITVTRVGEVAAEGEATLVTIPVYAWEWDGSAGWDSDYQWNKRGCAPQVTVSYKVKYGNVIYTNDYKVTDKKYIAGFSNVRQNVKTELDTSIANLKKTIGIWHSHTAQAVLDEAPTCETKGFENRTACSVCMSIVDWGTYIPATGHTYTAVEGVMQCSCGELLNGEYEGKFYVDGVALNGWVEDSYYVDGVMLTGIQVIDGYYYDLGEDGICEDQMKLTGLFTLDGDTYYAIAGERVKNRWIQVGEAWYCFRNDYKAYTGDATISGRLYHFGETGAITEGAWYDVDGYHRYYIGPNYYRSHWGLTIKEIDGVEYGFDENGDTVEGYVYNILAAGDPKRLFLFDDNGVRLPVPTEPTIITLDGQLRYIENAELQADNGLVKVGNDYYYVRGNGSLATGNVYISAAKSNGYGFIGYYDFGADFKLILKNGIIDGSYYIDGIKQANIGLVYVEGAYYYVKGNGSFATGRYYISEAKSNGLGFIGYYDFAEDGKLILKNGIVDGAYYIDGIKQADVGMVCVDGEYYYVRGNGNFATGRYYISEAKSNGFGFVGYYDFDEAGKLIIKNGIVDGSYYINGVKQANTGMVYYEGAYYYVKGNGNLATGTQYISATKSNGTGFIGYYDFGEDGKLLLKNGIVDGHYYIDGVKQTNVGLICVEGEYYYVKGNGDLATGTHYVSEAKSNGLGYVGYYDFDETGKLVLKNGIVDGHYYIEGVKQSNLGLIEVDGAYYYVKGNGNLATGRYYISEAKSNGYGFVGYYEFDETGKMIF